MSKVILLNGGKGCGKTDAVNELNKLVNLIRAECKEHLHDLTMKFFCVEEELYWKIYTDREAKECINMNFLLSVKEVNKLYSYLGKDLLSDEFIRYSPISIREAMIYVSEFICKPAFGEGYFGKARAKKIDVNSSNVYIDDSTGFVEELIPLIDKVGQDDILLIRIRGRGSFEGDSRDFIPDGVIANTIDVYNNGTLGQYLEEIMKIVLDFIME